MERRKYLGTPKEHLLRHVWQYGYLNDRIARGLKGKRWKIVTLTREPISRNLSTFFENLEVEPLGDGQRYLVRSDYYGFDRTVNIADVSDLGRLFFERVRHDSPLVFFDDELKSRFGVDVYATEFPAPAGYKIYSAENADVLLIRLENLNACARDAFKEFLDLDEFTLIPTNLSDEKPYAALFKRFKESIVLPPAYIDRMYQSKYMRHFYTQQEIASYRARWRTSDS
jgi:hypothetical protein